MPRRWRKLAKLRLSAVLRQNGGRRSFQRRQPLARFLGSFFAAWQRMNMNAAQRARTKCSVSVRRRSCSKSPQISRKKSIICPFCRLTYNILYAIMYSVRFFFPNITFFRKRHTLTSMPANQNKGYILPVGTRSHSVPFCFFMRSFFHPATKRKDRQHEKNRNRHGQ